MVFWNQTTAAGILVSVLLAGCATARPAPASDPRGALQSRPPIRLTAVIQGEPVTLNENLNHAGAGSAPGADSLEIMINASLSRLDNQGNLLGHLAESAPSVENGLWKLFPDGRMETTWRIRDGAQWHDGAPFTAADVLFTVQVEQDRDLPIRRTPAFSLFERLDAPDARTVVATWKSTFIWADTTFTRPFLPKHLLERAYAENKSTYLVLPYWTETFVGTGAYKVREFVRGSHAILDANDRYVLGRPIIDEIEVKFIGDAHTLIANLIAGTIDVFLGGGGRGLSLEQAMQVRDHWKDAQLDVKLRSWFVVYPQLLNPNPPILADLQFRRALLYAIDRQQLVDSLQGGLTSVAHTFVSPQSPDYKAIESSIVRYEYDPRRATQLIEGLGYTRGSDGIFRNADNQRLVLEARTPPQGDLYEKTLFAVADSWQRVGVAIELVVVPRQRVDEREYRATFPGVEVTGQPNRMDQIAQYFHSTEARLPENSFTGENRSRYRSAELDALLDRFSVTIRRQERVQVLSQIVRHMSDQLNVLGLYHTAGPVLYASRVSGFGAAFDGGTQAWNVHQWDVR